MSSSTARGPLVLVTYPAQGEQRLALESLLNKTASMMFLNDLAGEQRRDALEQADVVLTWNINREMQEQDYAALKNARLLQLISAGADHVPFRFLPKGLVIASNAGAYAEPMAEHILALTLALAKRLLIEQRKLMAGQFDQATPNRLLCGGTCGILGYGGIGKAAARLMRAMEMHIYAINSSGRTSEQVDFIGTLDDLETVLKASDVVVISLPFNKHTRGLIGQRQLEWMRPDAILINVARGDLIDEAALYHHLTTHPDFWPASTPGGSSLSAMGNSA